MHHYAVDMAADKDPTYMQRQTLQATNHYHNIYEMANDIRALWRSGLSARAPECQKLKMVLNLSNSSNMEQLALKGLMLS